MLEFKFLSGARSYIIDSLKFDLQGFVVGRNSCSVAGPAGGRPARLSGLQRGLTHAGRPGGRPAVGPPARTHSLQFRCHCRFCCFGATSLGWPARGPVPRRTRPRPQYPVSNACDWEVAGALYYYLKYFGTDWHDSTRASRRAVCLTVTLRLLNLISESPGPGTQRPYKMKI